MSDESTESKPAEAPQESPVGSCGPNRLRGGLAALFGASVAACTAAAVVGARVWQRKRSEQEAEWRRRAETARAKRSAAEASATTRSTSSAPASPTPASASPTPAAAAATAASSARSSRASKATAAAPDVRVFELRPGSDGWELLTEGHAPQRFPTKKAALDVARQTAREAEPSRLIVHRLDGTVQHRYTYGDPAS